jgi:CheY-like chemotaxis protein
MHLKKLLESAGYVVTEVDSGSKAFEIAKRDAPDLILLDIIMENGDGYQTCRQLKREPETNEIPVIMVSSKHNDVDRKWALKLGALDYIVKPYSDEALIQRLSEI